MGELHDVLKLAGITLPKSNDEEPEVDSIEVDHDDEEHHDDSEKIAVLSPADASYSTDKQTLLNVIKDKLKKAIS